MGLPFTFWLLASWATVALGAVLVLFGLFANRSKERLRCRKCWHSLEGVPSTEAGGKATWTCPECGCKATKLSQLKRTRRCWSVVLAGGVLLLLAQVPFNAPEIARLGRYALVPTWVYATVWPIDDLVDTQGYARTTPASDVLHDRLAHRLQRIETKLWLLRVRSRMEAGHAALLTHLQAPLETRVFDLTGDVRGMLDPDV